VVLGVVGSNPIIHPVKAPEDVINALNPELFLLVFLQPVASQAAPDRPFPFMEYMAKWLLIFIFTDNIPRYLSLFLDSYAKSVKVYD
jgi:hypothetical protein